MTTSSNADPAAGGRRRLGSFKVDQVDLRPDLGSLKEGPPRLFAPPSLLPIPFDMIAEDLIPAYPVIIGMGTGERAGWRYDCWMVGKRKTDAGTEIAVSPESELALAGVGFLEGRPPRFSWVPSERVWIERPADDIPPSLLAQDVPVGPPIRTLSRSLDTDRVIGRYGWLARREGWQLIVVVSDRYETEIDDAVKERAGRAGESVRDTFLHVMGRRAWWRWAVGAPVDEEEEIAAVVAEGVWLE